jgi:hypothetical protein
MIDRRDDNRGETVCGRSRRVGLAEKLSLATEVRVLYYPDAFHVGPWTPWAGCRLTDRVENESNQRIPVLACDRDHTDHYSGSTRGDRHDQLFPR